MVESDLALISVFRAAVYSDAGGTGHGLCVPGLQQRGRRVGPMTDCTHIHGVEYSGLILC